MALSALYRVRILLGARLGARREGAGLPIAALLMQAFVAATLCGLVRGALPPFAYALFALCVHAALVAIPLLGELGDLLVRDEADDWVRALPVTAADVKLARLAHLFLALVVLSLGSLVPAAALGVGLGALERLWIVVGGLGQALVLAAMLLLLLVTLGRRAQALLVLVQTALFVGVIVGGTVGLRHAGELARLEAPGAALALLPPAWFAAPLARAPGLAWSVAAPAAAFLALLVLLTLPAPARPKARAGSPFLGRLLFPVRRLAARTWVRRDERAVFELVFDALPKEREFVLRTYPLLGVPLAFLLVGAQGEQAAEGAGLLTLLLFTPGAYLPILLAHVPSSASHAARWLLDSAPVAPAAVRNGTLKALAVRFLLPLYLLLALLCWSLAGAGFALRLAPPAFLVALLVLRRLQATAVHAPPLSIPPDEVEAPQSMFQTMLGLGLILLFVALAAGRWIATLPAAAITSGALLAAELAGDRLARRG
jgi:hypothetical protein